jgi:hypothetical protein
VSASLQRLDHESEFDEGAPRVTGPSRLGGAVSERLRRLDDALGIDHSGGSEWIWGVPAFIFVATVVGFLVIGQITGGPWVVVEHLPSRPRLDANSAPAPADRELAAIAGPQHGEGVRAVGQAAPAPSRDGDRG